MARTIFAGNWIAHQILKITFAFSLKFGQMFSLNDFKRSVPSRSSGSSFIMSFSSSTPAEKQRIIFELELNKILLKTINTSEYALDSTIATQCYNINYITN